eukprot:CAMPEP_0119302744 /NCGR_PEP_ID=MMETSP1333-20130426/4294_1 /TAXON_ID=418940 /ORGANISM="Scyphosphaera apsteinii, Strain RCC1455" /LENGTH=433 /DNA_ID=CAMNT_0007305203 /DNA_START=202 /DNA_END=1503 /DNA_ORIENTATION=+
MAREIRAEVIRFAWPKLKRFVAWLALVGVSTFAINFNVQRVQMHTVDLGSSVNQKALSSKGEVVLPSGSRVQTAVAQLGQKQCVSQHQADTRSAQCQAFCNIKFKTFHCQWCKCRACEFCPKGGEAIDEALKAAVASPPPSVLPSFAPSLEAYMKNASRDSANATSIGAAGNVLQPAATTALNALSDDIKHVSINDSTARRASLTAAVAAPAARPSLPSIVSSDLDIPLSLNHAVSTVTAPPSSLIAASPVTAPFSSLIAAVSTVTAPSPSSLIAAVSADKNASLSLPDAISALAIKHGATTDEDFSTSSRVPTPATIATAAAASAAATPQSPPELALAVPRAAPFADSSRWANSGNAKGVDGGDGGRVIPQPSPKSTADESSLQEDRDVDVPASSLDNEDDSPQPSAQREGGASQSGQSFEVGTYSTREGGY